jgi:hypothetical protein
VCVCVCVRVFARACAIINTLVALRYLGEKEAAALGLCDRWGGRGGLMGLDAA